MCKHDLKLLYSGLMDSNSKNGVSYNFPPLFKCVKCHKVFKYNCKKEKLTEVVIA